MLFLALQSHILQCRKQRVPRFCSPPSPITSRLSPVAFPQSPAQLPAPVPPAGFVASGRPARLAELGVLAPPPPPPLARGLNALPHPPRPWTSALRSWRRRTGQRARGRRGGRRGGARRGGPPRPGPARRPARRAGAAGGKGKVRG